MKKLIAILLAVFVLSTAALAVGHGCGGRSGIRACDGTGIHAHNADRDGVCDYCGTGTCGMGRAYVDADGDGVCDHYGTGRCGGARCGWAAQ